jgi:hypothetical protein
VGCVRGEKKGESGVGGVGKREQRDNGMIKSMLMLVGFCGTAEQNVLKL